MLLTSSPRVTVTGGAQRGPVAYAEVRVPPAECIAPCHVLGVAPDILGEHPIAPGRDESYVSGTSRKRIPRHHVACDDRAIPQSLHANAHPSAGSWDNENDAFARRRRKPCLYPSMLPELVAVEEASGTPGRWNSCSRCFDSCR